MSIHSPAAISSSFRHRIQEISLPPIPSAQAIKLELHVDDKPVHVLPSIDSSHLLRWNMQMFPCDVHLESRVTIKIVEKHRWSTKRIRIAGYQISATAGQTTMDLSTSIAATRPPVLRSSPKPSTNNDPVVVTLTFPTGHQIESEYALAYIKAKVMIENEKGPLGGLGNAPTVFKAILGFGIVVAELNPAAKVVVSLCTKAWEHLEEFQRLHDDMQRLINGLTRIIPFLDFVKEHSKESLLEGTISALLDFIEDVSSFVIVYLSNTPTGAVSILATCRTTCAQFDRWKDVRAN
ncbi:hypothetical protein BDV93DRAFT_515116 [Ceratobasidium sp. AG-I]|nr:hypothetical protein BDV93DRAFT_515116 [Ceratobasidium sp. AG-I]